ncbi:hypothetical protein STRDD13_00626 [Streptococcus sp. DD13]|nr:hypothetical protein STRDD13_00626 [Streptococcus sp. DD13]
MLKEPLALVYTCPLFTTLWLEGVEDEVFLDGWQAVRQQTLETSSNEVKKGFMVILHKG